MTGGRPLTAYFHRNDDRRERVRLTHCTVAQAIEAIQRIFGISEGLYTKAEIYRGERLVETVANPSSIRVTSILVQ
jgi:hypothetical protein